MSESKTDIREGCARPLRIEFSGALYHVTALDNAGVIIYGNDDDRQYIRVEIRVEPPSGSYLRSYGDNQSMNQSNCLIG